MPFSETFSDDLAVSVGGPTKASDYNNLSNNTDALKERFAVQHFINNTGVDGEDGYHRPIVILMKDAAAASAIVSMQHSWNPVGGTPTAGQILRTDWIFDNSSNAQTTFARMDVGIDTVTASSEDGYVKIYPIINGAFSNEQRGLIYIDQGGVVIGGTVADSLMDFTVSGSEGASGGIAIWADNGDDNADRWGVFAGTDGKLYISTYASGSYASVFVINSATGNVGINTTSPSSRLHVKGTLDVLQIESSSSQTSQYNGGAYSVYLVNTDTTVNNWDGIAFADAVDGAVAAMIQIKYTDHTNNYGELHFTTRGAGGIGSRLIIDEDGGVHMPYLPTSDPAVAGQLWVDSSAGYAIKQSQG